MKERIYRGIEACEIEQIIKSVENNHNVIVNCDNTDTHWLLCLYEKCGIQIVEELFSKIKLDLNIMYRVDDGLRVSLVLEAYSKQYYDLVKLLLENNANPMQDARQHTLVHWMASVNDIEMLNSISNFDFDIDSKDYFNGEEDRTPLHWCAQGNCVEASKFLLEHNADIDAVEMHGHTALIMAAGEGAIEMVDFLIENGADVNIVGDYGNTALIAAELNGYPLIVEKLKKITESNTF